VFQEGYHCGHLVSQVRVYLFNPSDQLAGMSLGARLVFGWW
jgi:hypothetical protein